MRATPLVVGVTRDGRKGYRVFEILHSLGKVTRFGLDLTQMKVDVGVIGFHPRRLVKAVLGAFPLPFTFEDHAQKVKRCEFLWVFANLRLELALCFVHTRRLSLLKRRHAEQEVGEVNLGVELQGSPQFAIALLMESRILVSAPGEQAKSGGVTHGLPEPRECAAGCDDVLLFEQDQSKGVRGQVVRRIRLQGALEGCARELELPKRKVGLSQSGHDLRVATSPSHNLFEFARREAELLIAKMRPAEFT